MFSFEAVDWASFMCKGIIIAIFDHKSSIFSAVTFSSFGHQTPGSGSRMRGWIRIRDHFGIETNADPQHWLEKTLEFNILYGTEYQ
jgi:hypothetical protein